MQNTFLSQHLFAFCSKNTHNHRMQNAKLVQIFFLAPLLYILLAIPALASISPPITPVTFSLAPYSLSEEKMQGTMLELRITPQKDYLVYANKNGEAGRPLEVTPDQTDSPVTAYYPAGTAKPDLFDTSKIANVHKGPTTVLLHVEDPQVKRLDISVSLLLCSTQNCRPVLTRLHADWDPDTLEPVSEQTWWPINNNYTKRPLQSIVGEQIKQAQSLLNSAKKLHVDLPQTVKAPRLKGSSPSQVSVLGQKSESDQTKTIEISSLSELPLDETPLIGKKDKSVLAEAISSGDYQFTPRYFIRTLEVTSLAKALLLGLLAGFILNFMPCVLPVISLKLTSLLHSGHEEAPQNRIRTFREHNLFFALGVLTWFCALAVLLTAAGLAWGQLFQNEWILTGLTTIVFCLGLSAFDVFHLPMFNVTPKDAGNSKRSAFATGLLATLLATPCSGPFLGGVLGWAFLQPPVILASTFMAIGVGMALPYFALAMAPQLSRFLPKAGRWTGTLSKLVGFFLMGTTAYLLSLLPASQLPTILFLLWLTGLCAWIWGEFGSLRAPKWRRNTIGILCIICISISAWIALQPKSTEAPWQQYNKAHFLSALGKRPMLVDFTADWCPNCKVLEHTVLTEKNRIEWATKYGIDFIQVDMTRLDADKQKLLAALGSSSIPVVAIFPVGPAARSPIVLRDIFTTSQAERALKKALQNQPEQLAK